jgi:beta-glucosidase
MKDTTKHSYFAASFAAVGLIALASCSLKPSQNNGSGGTPGGGSVSGGGQGGSSLGGQSGTTASSGGSTIGGSGTGGTTPGGSTTGGSTIGGTPSGGSTIGGSGTGGTPAGGSTIGGSGGSRTGGSTIGGTPAGGSTTGGSRSGGAGGASSAGGAGGVLTGGSSGARSGGTPAGGSSTGGSVPSGGSPAGGSVPSGGSIPTGNVTACTSASPAPTYTIPTPMKPVDAQATSLVNQMASTDKINILSGDHTTTPYTTAGVAFRSLGVASLNIPNYPMRDGPRGMRNIMPGDVATAFAVAEARAASFDLDLEYKVGNLQGREMRAAKNELSLAPVINTLRHPRWARAQETYGEDPVLLGEMGAAFVRGMQQPGGCAACPKHYVLNDTDNNRMQANPNVDMQTLHENYSRPFEITVKKGDPACIMAAYNMVNGTHCTENKSILGDILRTQWGWGGFVVSDWSAAQAGHGALSMNAGLDLEMPVPSAFTTLSGDLTSGTLTSARLTEAATLVMNARTKFKDLDSGYMSSTASFGLAGAQEAVDLAEKTELEGAVLLKNDGILPLGTVATTVGSGSPNAKTIAIVGPDNNLPVAPTAAQNNLANFVSGLGDRGSSQVVAPHAVSYAQGLQARGGLTIKQSSDSSAANGADVVIIPVSMAHEDEGESYGGGADRQDMTLSGAHPKHWTTKPSTFIKSVAAINPNVIVLLNVGSAIIVEDWMASAKAIIQTFYPGQEGGTALAALLFGDSNFSGKLPFTVGQNESDYPQFQNSGSASATIDYYHGYRLFEKNAKPVRYWFGYGMSYTTYSYSNLQVLCSNSTIPATGALNVQVTVSNTGKVAGDEVVELYIGYPNSKAPKRPVKELKTFTRVTLAAGESKNVQLSIPASDTAYWDMTNSKWTVESVAHTVLVGLSADPTKLLSATFTIQ